MITERGKYRLSDIHAFLSHSKWLQRKNHHKRLKPKTTKQKDKCNRHVSKDLVEKREYLFCE